MRILIGVSGLAVLAALVASAGPADAAQPPRVEAYQCGPLVTEVGADNVWQTWFRGQKTGVFDWVDRVVAAPCFTSEANCKAWLYWAQSDYPEFNAFRACHRGTVY
jgi:hypothetical protein